MAGSFVYYGVPSVSIAAMGRAPSGEFLLATLIRMYMIKLSKMRFGSCSWIKCVHLVVKAQGNKVFCYLFQKENKAHANFIICRSIFWEDA